MTNLDSHPNPPAAPSAGSPPNPPTATTPDPPLSERLVWNPARPLLRRRSGPDTLELQVGQGGDLAVRLTVPRELFDQLLAAIRRDDPATRYPAAAPAEQPAAEQPPSEHQPLAQHQPVKHQPVKHQPVKHQPVKHQPAQHQQPVSGAGLDPSSVLGLLGLLIEAGALVPADEWAAANSAARLADAAGWLEQHRAAAARYTRQTGYRSAGRLGQACWPSAGSWHGSDRVPAAGDLYARRRAAVLRIVGAGRVGTAVAVLAAHAGLGRIEIDDPSTVGPRDITPFGFRPGQVARPRRQAVAALVAELNVDCQVVAAPRGHGGSARHPGRSSDRRWSCWPPNSQNPTGNSSRS